MSSHLANFRMQLIMSALSAQGECRTSELAQRFRLSENTIRRDLLELEEQGLLLRVHGGAVLVDQDVAYANRLEHSVPQKRAIGRAAAALIESGQNIYLDVGSTTHELVAAIREGLPTVTHLHIFTNGVKIAGELIGQTPYNVHLIGGEIYQNTFCTVGPSALAHIDQFRFDLFFMGANGVDPERGWTNSNHMEVLVKRAVISRSKRVFALVDSSKWRVPSLAQIVPLGGVKHWLVDAGLPAEAKASARAAGVEVNVAAATQ
jgi:DeoR/GlpR family transcriptional regulator of sugar metabolism